MYITFPHLGDIHVAIRLMCEDMGVPVIVPSKNTNDILQRGMEISPEDICLPFKLMAGNLIDAYERGARKAVMPATMGPCRLGEYAELLKSILDREGYEYEWILIDAVSAIGIKEFINRVSSAFGERACSTLHAAEAARRALLLQQKTDGFLALAHATAGNKKKPELCAQYISLFRKEIATACNFKEAFAIIKKYESMVRTLEERENLRSAADKPISVYLSGEIYTLTEPFANHYIEDKLMRLGVNVKKTVTVSWWVKETLPKPALVRERRYKECREYLPVQAGGYARETVREGKECLAEKMDGMIQIFPTGCMPEIVSKAVLTEMSEREGIPVLSIIYDEMSGEAGYATRIEAFVDMLRMNREERKRCMV